MLIAGEGVASSPILQLGVLISACAGAIATVVGALSAAKAKRAADSASADAAKAADKHATVEERIVNKDEFTEVVEGLRSIIQMQREQIDGQGRRLDEQESETRELRAAVVACHDEKVTLRQDFGQERRELHARITELGGTPP